LKKFVIWLLTALLIIFSNSPNLYAYQTKWRNIEWGYDIPLFLFNYEQLDKQLEKFNNNKISFDECIISGIKFLKENENQISSCDDQHIERAYKIQHNSPIKFIAFLYANYNNLSPAALKELQSSLWDLTPYLNKAFSSKEIELLNSIEPTIKLNRPQQKLRDLIDAFQKLVDYGYMNKAEAAVHILLIRRTGGLLKKYNTSFKEFWQTETHITGWIKENENEIKSDKRAFRLIQLLLSTFSSVLNDYLKENAKVNHK